MKFEEVKIEKHNSYKMSEEIKGLDAAGLDSQAPPEAVFVVNINAGLSQNNNAEGSESRKGSPESSKSEDKSQNSRLNYIATQQKILYDKFWPMYQKLKKIKYATSSEEKEGYELLRLPLWQAKDKIPIVKGLLETNPTNTETIYIEFNSCILDTPNAFPYIKRFFEFYGGTPESSIKLPQKPIANNKVLRDSFADLVVYQLFMKIMRDNPDAEQLIESAEELEAIESLINICNYYKIQPLLEMAACFKGFTIAYYSEGQNMDLHKLYGLYGINTLNVSKGEFERIVEMFPEFFVGYNVDSQSIDDAFEEYRAQLEYENEVREEIQKKTAATSAKPDGSAV